MKKIDKVRRFDLDILRIAAIIAVIVIHCMAGVVLIKPVESPSWMIGNIIDSLMRWAVPVFIMISGALVIKPESFSNMTKFFKKRLTRLLVPIIIWPLLYTVWYVIVRDRPFDWDTLWTGYLLGVPGATHLYFLFLIFGLYCLTPVISLYAHHATKRQFNMTTLAVLLVTTLWYSLESTLPGHSQSINVVTQGLPYVGYFMAGYALKDVTIKNIYLPIATFFIASACIALFTFQSVSSMGVEGNGLFHYAYPSIFVMISSLSIFLAMGAVKNKMKLPDDSPTGNIITRLSGATFGVYLIHMMILEGLVGATELSSTSLKSTLLLIPLVLVLSFCLSLIISKIRFLRQLIT